MMVQDQINHISTGIRAMKEDTLKSTCKSLGIKVDMGVQYMRVQLAGRKPQEILAAAFKAGVL